MDPDILIAIVRIQALFRGYRTRLALYLHEPRNVISLVLATHQSVEGELPGNPLAPEILSQPDAEQICRCRLAQAKRVTDGWFKCTQLLQQPQVENEIGTNLVRSLALAGLVDFSQDLEQTIDYCDYTGSYNELGQPETMSDTSPGHSDKSNAGTGHGWISLLFRQLIQIPVVENIASKCPSPIPFSMRFKCDLPGTRLLLINNDTGRQAI